MTRSRKKHAFGGFTTSESEKKDKRYANRTFRRKNKRLLYSLNEDDETPRPLHNKATEVSDNWNFDKDGKINYAGTEWEKVVKRK